MVIHDLDFESVSIRPTEADAPLVIDPDAVLSLAIARQGLRRLPGMAPRSDSAAAACKWSSFRLAIRAMAWNLRLNSRRKTFSVSLSRNDRIRTRFYYRFTFNAKPYEDAEDAGAAAPYNENRCSFAASAPRLPPLPNDWTA